MDLDEKLDGHPAPDYDEHDDGEVVPVPNWIPVEAQRAPANPASEAEGGMPSGEAAAGSESGPAETGGQGEHLDKAIAPVVDGVPADEAIAAKPVAGEPGIEPGKKMVDAPEVTNEGEEPVVLGAEGEQPVPEAPGEPQAEAAGAEMVSVNRDVFEALMSVARKLDAGARLVDPDELRRVNAAVEHGSVAMGAAQTQGQQQVKAGAQALAEGGMSLLGGAAALTGAALKAGGKAAASLAGALREQDTAQTTVEVASGGASAGVAVLPRISEYRIDQAEKAEGAYGGALEKFWASGNLPSVRKEIEERARQTGLSVEDVMDKMKPNGEMAELHDKFKAAVAESPDAQSCKKAMDKALDGWVRQYGRGREELLNPETEGNPYFEGLRERLENSYGRMQKNTAKAPLFDGEERSHAEKLRETIQRIMEKLKEIAKDFVNMVRGKRGAEAEADHAPGA